MLNIYFLFLNYIIGRSILEQFFQKYKPQIKAAIEKQIPRIITNEYLHRTCGEAKYTHDPASLTNSISTPIYDMIDRGINPHLFNLHFLKYDFLVSFFRLHYIL